MSWIRPLFIGSAITALIGLVALLALYAFYQSVLEDLPRLPENPAELGLRPGTEIFAASGERMYSFNQTRQWVDLDQVSPYVLQALSATEDAAFFYHRGIDLKAIMAAAWSNLWQGYGSRGGSTLTQQLVKRLFFSPRKTIRRKFSEALLALELEALYARSFPGLITPANGKPYPLYKHHLLELYLNTVFYGANAYGLADASEVYFNRAPRNLSLPQAALLMGLINAPSAYNPLQHPERATRRLQHVLERMRRTGFLSLSARLSYANLQAEELINPHRAPQNPAPYWVEAIKAEIARRWGVNVLRYGALKIHTTLDMKMQKMAEGAIAWGVAELDRRMGFKAYGEASLEERKKYVQAALVCLEPHSGRLKAMVGGRDIFVSYYNRALTARRQPGSGFKPVAYLAALEAGALSPTSLFLDAPRTFAVDGKSWEPRNYNDQYLGLTTAAWALIKSANSTAVQITRKVGPEQVVDTARRLGFAGSMGAYMSIALGVNEVTVLEMASAYGALAASGLLVEPTLVDRIIDAEGRELFAHEPQIKQAVAPDLAFQMVQILQLALDRGTGRRVRKMGFGKPAAGKTGTTNDNTDAWFTGFTPDLVSSVWVGFDQRRSHKLLDAQGRQITGGSGAAPIWTKFMQAATAEAPPKKFSIPTGLRLVRVNPLRGTVALAADSSAPAPIILALRPHESTTQQRDLPEFDSLARQTRPDSLGRGGMAPDP